MNSESLKCKTDTRNTDVSQNSFAERNGRDRGTHAAATAGRPGSRRGQSRGVVCGGAGGELTLRRQSDRHVHYLGCGVVSQVTTGSKFPAHQYISIKVLKR